MDTTTTTNGFQNLGIAPKLFQILLANKFITPTPIQQQSIAPGIEGKDIMGIAQTGTGKTLAFGIPMIQRLAQAGGKTKGLIILPTRELALQVNETLKKIGSGLGLKTAILIGGENMGKQIRALHLNPHIIIATPGRLIDHLESKHINLSNVGILVMDEADRMLDMGFAPQIKKILATVPKQRQTMLFSATMPDEIVNIAKSYMSLPLRIEVAPAGTAIELVTQELFFVHQGDKPALLQTLLTEYKGSILVFARTKFGAKKIAQTIRNNHHTASEIHSNRSLNQRIEALDGFKIGRYRVLVATDIAARGIDVTGIELVINYDLPSTPEDYVHRIGRTGRAGLAGKAVSFAMPEQRHEVRSIERVIRSILPVSQLPVLQKVERPAKDFNDDKYADRRPQSYNRSSGRSFDNKPFGKPSFSKSFGRSTSTSSSRPAAPSNDRQSSYQRSDSKYSKRDEAPSRSRDENSSSHAPRPRFGRSSKPAKRTPWSR
jgi:ATP-dependent RNA helicase RhlE